MKKGIKSWLISWRWTGNHRVPEFKSIWLLNPRHSSRKVREIMEVIYANSEERSLYQRLEYVKKPKSIRIKTEVRGSGITVGDNPWLYGRLVESLRLKSSDNISTLFWIEPRKEEYDKTLGKWIFTSPPIEEIFRIED